MCKRTGQVTVGAGRPVGGSTDMRCAMRKGARTQGRVTKRKPKRSETHKPLTEASGHRSNSAKIVNGPVFDYYAETDGKALDRRPVLYLVLYPSCVSGSGASCAGKHVAVLSCNGARPGCPGLAGLDAALGKLACLGLDRRVGSSHHLITANCRMW